MEVGVKGLQRPAPYVQENLRHWSREDHQRGINQAIGLALEKKADKTKGQSRSCTQNRRACQ